MRPAYNYGCYGLISIKFRSHNIEKLVQRPRL